MIVQRDVFQVKPGKMMEVLDLVKQSLKISPIDEKVRIYTDFIGQQNTMAVEIEYENLTDLEKSYEESFANEKLAAIFEKLAPITTATPLTIKIKRSLANSNVKNFLTSLFCLVFFSWL